MADNGTRIIGFSCVLVGVWVVTYWLWTPLGPRVTVDQRPGPLATEPVPEAAPSPPAESATKPVEPPAEPASVESMGTTSKLLAPQFRDYVVKAGDTSFEKIAARPEVFGDAKKGEAIARSNKFADPTKLKPGVTVLRIPLDPDNIEGKVVQVLQAPGGTSETVVTSPPTTPSEPAAVSAEPMRTYTLKQGDTLWDVAKKFYGKGASWKLIAEANKDVVPRPDHPPIGVTIKIPPEPADPKADKPNR
jgi:nucleoid-associated protein YgaU